MGQPNDTSGDFTVLVLDAVSGKPVPGARVDYWCVGMQVNATRSEIQSVETNDKGVASVPYCKSTEELGISAKLPKKKSQCGSTPGSLMPERIKSEGVVFAADSGAGLDMSCSTKVTKKVKPVPGQVTIFVKKPSWWQSHFPG